MILVENFQANFSFLRGTMMMIATTTVSQQTTIKWNWNLKDTTLRMKMCSFTYTTKVLQSWLGDRDKSVSRVEWRLIYCRDFLRIFFCLLLFPLWNYRLGTRTLNCFREFFSWISSFLLLLPPSLFFHLISLICVMPY